MSFEEILQALNVAQLDFICLSDHPSQGRADFNLQWRGVHAGKLFIPGFEMRGGLRALMPDLLLNLRRYPDHLYRKMFHRPVEFLRRWDELNRNRRITGIAANDCHQNVGFRGFYTTNGTIRIEDTSPRTLKKFKLNLITRPLARLAFGPLEPGRRLFHVQIDPYERLARFVNTHVLARALAEPAILDSLRAGRVFVGFDAIADSSTFRWFVRDQGGFAVMGESFPFSDAAHLHARSPLLCRFSIFKDGRPAHQTEGRAVDWTPAGPGQYRVEAESKVLGQWVPWVYANPIRLECPPPTSSLGLIRLAEPPVVGGPILIHGEGDGAAQLRRNSAC